MQRRDNFLSLNGQINTGMDQYSMITKGRRTRQLKIFCTTSAFREEGLKGICSLTNEAMTEYYSRYSALILATKQQVITHRIVKKPLALFPFPDQNASFEKFDFAPSHLSFFPPLLFRVEKPDGVLGRGKAF